MREVMFQKIQHWHSKHRSKILSFVILFLLIILEHAFLFGSYYKHLGSVIGSGGDAYYNLSLFMQNILNWKHGQFFSLQGDHISFYQNVIGVTAHVISPSVIFALLLPIFNNPILVFNLIFFTNIILLQLGIYFLVRFYTKNTPIAIFAALFTITSPAVVAIYYVGHIHASLYWTLPFLILLFEKVFQLKNATTKQLTWYGIGIFLCTLWLFFSDWHVAIFASVWIGLWLLFHVSIFKNIKKNYKTLLVLFVPVIIAGILLAPLAKKYFETSKIYNAERTPDVVVNTNMNLEDYLGFSRVIPVAVDIVKPFVKNHPYAIDRLDHYKGVANEAGAGFPDPFFRITFWVGIVLVLPLFTVFVWSRGKSFKNALILLGTVIFSGLIMIGPAIKMGGILALETLPLPYYFLYSWFTPLHAFRALWRASTVGSLAVTVLWSMGAAFIWQKLRDAKNLPLAAGDDKSTGTKIAKGILVCMLVVFAIGVLLYQNSGYRGGYIPAKAKDDFFFTSMEKHVKPSEPISFALVSDNMEEGNYNLQTSWFNLEHNRRAVEFAIGGIGGFLPLDWLTALNLTRQHESLDTVIEMYSAKGVDVLVADKKYFANDPLARIALASHYKLSESNDSVEVWALASSASSAPQSALRYSLALSQFQEKGKKWNGMLNIENPTSLPFANPEKVHTVQFELSFSGTNIAEKFSLGEQSMIFAKTGASVPITLHPKLATGNYSWTLKREGVEVAHGTVLVLPQNEYEQKVLDAKKQTLETYSNVVVAPFSMDLYQIPVKLEFSVVSGGFINQPKERIVRNNQTVTVQFFGPDGNALKLQHFFEQPDCKFSGNALPGDNIELWCYQYVPANESYSSAKVE